MTSIQGFSNQSVNVSIVRGGFVVTYPELGADGNPVYVQEAVNTVGKAMKLVKTATEAFSLVKKSEEDTPVA